MYIITNYVFVEITTNFSLFSNYSLMRSQIDCIHTSKNDKNHEWLKNLNIYNDDGNVLFFLLMQFMMESS